MKCQQAQKLILLRQSSELSARQASQIERHILKCPYCKAFSEDIDRVLKTSSSALKAGNPAASALSAIYFAGSRKIEKRKILKQKYLLFPIFANWRVLAASAAAILVCIGVWYALKLPERQRASILSAHEILEQVASDEFLFVMQEISELSYSAEDNIRYLDSISILNNQSDTDLLDNDLMIFNILII